MMDVSGIVGAWDLLFERILWCDVRLLSVFLSSFFFWSKLLWLQAKPERVWSRKERIKGLTA